MEVEPKTGFMLCCFFFWLCTHLILCIQILWFHFALIQLLKMNRKKKFITRWRGMREEERKSKGIWQQIKTFMWIFGWVRQKSNRWKRSYLTAFVSWYSDTYPMTCSFVKGMKYQPNNCVCVCVRDTWEANIRSTYFLKRTKKICLAKPKFKC